MTTPSILSISGVANDGQSLIINGSNFGSHSLDIEWLGGQADGNGNIEDGTSGTPSGTAFPILFHFSMPDGL